MKNAKRIAAIAAGLALTFSAVGTVFAADDKSAAGTTAAQTETKKDYGSLSYTTSPCSYQGVAIGSYPVISGIGSLNQKITADIEQFLLSSLDNLVDDDGSSFVDASVSGAVKDGDDGVYATVTVTTVANASTGLSRAEQIKTYYVDKSSNSEVSEAAYKAGLEALAQAEEDAKNAAEEAQLSPEEIQAILDTPVPLAATLKDLGYKYVTEGSSNVGDAKTFTWIGATNKVSVYDADGNLSVVTEGSKTYKSGGKDVNLGVAAENRNGSVYVPASYFNQILNLDTTQAENGTISFSVPK